MGGGVHGTSVGPWTTAYGDFVSQLICYVRVCSKYEDFLFTGSILVSKLLKQGYSSQTTFRKFYRPCSQIWHLCFTYNYMLNGLFTNCDIWLVSSYNFCKSWRVPHVGQEMLTLSGTPDFTTFGEFMILLHLLYMHCVLLNFVLGLCLQINDSGLFPGLVWLLSRRLILLQDFHN